MIMNKEIRFYTTEEEARKAAKQSKYNVFYLEEDNWDDYGYKTLFVLNQVDNDGVLNSIGSVKIAQKGQKEGRTKFNSKSFNELSEDYFSLGLYQEYYEDLKELDEAADVLQKLRDIAYEGNEQECKDRCKRLCNEEKVVRLSLLRAKDLATVVRDFRGVFKSIEPYKIIGFSYLFNSEGINASDGYSSKELKCDVELDNFIPSNIHALIGINGVGKTRFLNEIIKSYLFKKEPFISIIGNDRKEQLGELNFDKDEMLSRKGTELSFSHITYVPADSTVANGIFEFEVDEGKEIDYFNMFIEFGLSLQDDKNNRSIETISNLSSVQQEEGTRAKEIFRFYSWLLYSLDMTGESFIPSLDDYVRQKNEKKFTKWFKEENLKGLSSGQLKTLYLFYSMTNIVERGLYVIDEPENSLHAPLLSAFMYTLRKLLVKRKAMAIIATHSPVVLREVPRNCVHVLRSREGLRYVTHPSIETFGENLGVLLNEIFGLNADKSGYFTYLKEKAKEAYRACKGDLSEEKTFKDVCIKKFGAKLGMEARALLPYIVKEAQLEVDGERSNEKY